MALPVLSLDPVKAYSVEVWDMFWHLIKYFNGSVDTHITTGDCNFGDVQPSMGVQTRTIKHSQIMFGPEGHDHQWDIISPKSLEKRNFDLNSLSVLWQNYYASGQKEKYNFHPVCIPGQISIDFGAFGGPSSYQRMDLPIIPTTSGGWVSGTTYTSIDLQGSQYDNDPRFWELWKLKPHVMGYILHWTPMVANGACWLDVNSITNKHRINLKFSTNTSATFTVNYFLFVRYTGSPNLDM